MSAFRGVVDRPAEVDLDGRDLLTGEAEDLGVAVAAAVGLDELVGHDEGVVNLADALEVEGIQVLMYEVSILAPTDLTPTLTGRSDGRPPD